MQKKRLFIALPLPASVARSIKKISAELEAKCKDFSGGRIRFVPREHWHITVSFLGNTDDAMLPMIADAAAAVSRTFEPPEIVFEKISYGPFLPKRGRGENSAHNNAARGAGFFSEKPGTVKMIWLAADRASSERIAKIKSVLEDGLSARGVSFQREMKIFSGHITLARFAKETARASLPQIEKPVQFSFSAPSLDLMESELARSAFAKTPADKTGAEYSVIQSFPFKE